MSLFPFDSRLNFGTDIFGESLTRRIWRCRENTGTVSRMPQTRLPCVEVGEAHAEERATASRKRFFAASL